MTTADDAQPAVTDPAYRLRLLDAAMTRRGLSTAPDTPANPAVLAIAAATSEVCNHIVVNLARSPHALRFFAALLEAWSTMCDELAVFGEDAVARRLTADLDGELARLAPRPDDTAGPHPRPA